MKDHQFSVMKLHLPLNLRTALALSLAAFAAAPSHAAVSQLTIPGFDATQGYISVGGMTNGQPNSLYMQLPKAQTWNTNWSVVVSAKGSTLTGNLTLMGLYMTRADAPSGVSEGATMTGGNLNLTTWSEWGADAPPHQSSGIDFTQYENVTLVMSRDGGALTLSAYDSSDFSTALFTSTQSTDQSFDKYSLAGFVLGALGTHTKLDNNDNNVTFAADSEVGSYSVTKVGFSSGSVANSVDLYNYYYTGNHKTLTWSGGADGVWSDASWREGEASNQSFSTLDSVIFDTADATVALSGTVGADNIAVNDNTTIEPAGHSLIANSITVAAGKKITLSGAGAVEVASLSGGSADVNSSNLTVTNAISNTTLAVSDGGSLTLSGTAIGNTTVNGTLTVAASDRVMLTGNVTLGSVKNNRDGGNTYAFVGDNANVTLKFTGTTDLTKKEDEDGVTTNTHSWIGLKQGKLVVAKDASLTMGRLYFNSGNNAKVEADGKLVMQSGNAENKMHYLKVGATGEVVSGSESTLADLIVRNQVEVVDEVIDGVAHKGKLKAGALKIGNTDGTQTKLGGEVKVGTLSIAKGSAEISGYVTAGKVDDSAGGTGTYVGTTAGKGTLTITGAAGDATCGSTLSGNFTVVKQGGTNTQTFNGSGNDLFTGSLQVEAGVLNLTNMDADIRSLQSITIANGTTLGLYSGAGASGAVATVTASKLEAKTGGGTLNANVVMGADTALVLDSSLALGGALTLDGTLLSGALLGSLNSGATDSITLFTGVASLTVGSAASTLAAEGTPFSAVTFDGYREFTDDELAAAFGNAFDASAYTASYTAANGGSIVMTANVPEPATATLSLLALAGLCARRRRK